MHNHKSRKCGHVILREYKFVLWIQIFKANSGWPRGYGAGEMEFQSIGSNLKYTEKTNVDQAKVIAPKKEE